MIRLLQFLCLVYLYIVYISHAHGSIVRGSPNHFQNSSCQHCFHYHITESTGKMFTVTPCGGPSCIPLIKNDDINKVSIRPTQYYDFNQCGVINSSLRFNRAIQVKISTGVENTLRQSEYPWLVRIESKSSVLSRTVTLCGGTLIHPQWVLTAAQCMFDLKTKQLFLANGIKIYIGHYNRLTSSKDEVIMQVAAYIIQPKFSIGGRSIVPMHDLALIKLSKPAPLSHSIGIACLPQRSDKLSVGALAYTAGWGHTSPNSSAVNEPRKTRIKITDSRSCRKLMVDGNLHVCGRNNRGENICEGDGGSGLMLRARIESNIRTNNNDWKWYVFGVASYGPKECSQSANHDNAFASVVTDVDWIHEMIQKY